MKIFSLSAGIAAVALVGTALYLVNAKSAAPKPAIIPATQEFANSAFSGSPENTITSSVSIPEDEEVTQTVEVIRKR